MSHLTKKICRSINFWKLFFSSFCIPVLLTLVSNNVSAQCNPTCANNNTLFGLNAGMNTTGNFNSFFGQISGELNTTGQQNAFFGHQSGYNNTTGSSNTFIGYSAGFKNNTGSGNAFFGGVAGSNNTTGMTNSFFGENAGYNNTTGSFNTFFGTRAGFSNTTGSSNAIIGQKSLRKLASGSKNTSLGTLSGENILSGDLNVLIGYGAGPTNSTLNNRLFIDVDEFASGNNKPLIYGEFDNDFVKINGTFEVTAGLSNPSSRTLKQEFESVEASQILEKISNLDIQQWTYKHRPNEKHIGAIAEDFHAAFGLGEGDKNISTIDADGVMMLAIQALVKENEQLKNRLDKQSLLLEDLLKRL